MTTEVSNPNLNDTTADASEAGEDTALAAAAKAEDGAETTADAEVEGDKGETEAGEDAPEGAPEAYDTSAWQMPEGVEFDTEGFSAVEPTLRDLNLSQDQAGKLMGAYAEKIVPMITERTLKAQDDAAAELRSNLARELQDDPEVGGKKLEESRSYAAKAIAHFIPDKNERAQFSEFLNESGFGNHKLLMRLVAGAGRAISEASTPAAETASKPLSEAEKFYGKGGN